MRRVLKNVLYTIVAISLPIVVLIVSIPTLVSTQWGKEWVLSIVNHSIPGKLEVDQLSMGWFKGVDAQGIRLKTKAHEEVLSAEFIQYHTPLWNVFRSEPTLKFLDLKEFNLNIDYDPLGRSSVEKAIGFVPTFLNTGSKSSLHLKHVNAHVNLPSHLAGTTLTLSGQTERGSLQGNFDIAVQLTGIKRHRVDKDATFVFKAELNKLPIEVLHLAFGQKYPSLVGYSYALFGDNITRSFNKTFNRDQINFWINLHSSNHQTRWHRLMSYIAVSMLSEKGKTTVTVDKRAIQDFFLPEGWKITDNMKIDFMVKNIDWPSDNPDVNISWHLRYPQVVHSTQGKLVLEKFNGSFQQRQFQIQSNWIAEGKPFSINLKGSIDDLLNPLEANLDINKFPVAFLNNDHLIKAIGKIANANLTWSHDQPMHLSFSGNKLLFQDMEIDLSGLAKVPELIWRGDSEPHTFKEVSIPWNENSVSFISKIDDEGELKLNLNKDYSWHAEGKNVSSTLLESINLDPTLQTLIGSNLTFDVQGIYDSVKGYVNTENLKAQLNGTSADFTWLASPEQLALLQTTFHLKPDELWSAVGPQEFHVKLKSINKDGLEADINADSLVFEKKDSDELLTIEKFHLGIDAKDYTKALHLELQSKEMECRASIAHLNQLDKMTLRIDGQATEFPLPDLLDALVSKEYGQKARAVFGKHINVEVDMDLHQLTGPVALNVQGESGLIKLDGIFSQGILRLNQPIEGRVLPSPLLGKELGSIISFLEEITETADHIQFKIPVKNFAFDVRVPFWKGLHIERGSLDLGRLMVQNSGEFKQLIDSLKSSSQKELPVWFTPLYFGVVDGAIKINRVDLLLADRYPIASWGSVDMLNKKVRLKLALSGKAIKDALGIHNIADNYYETFTIKGPLGKAKIDKAQMSSRLGSLVMKSQGSPEGVIVGALLDFVNGKMTHKNEVPSPTTSPFPWHEKYN